MYGPESQKKRASQVVDRPDDFPVLCKRQMRNFELLGSPIGDADFCTAYIDKFVAERVDHLEAQGVNDPKSSTTYCVLVSLFAEWCT